MSQGRDGIPSRLDPVVLLRIEDYLLLAAALLLPWAFGGVAIWGYRTASLLLVGAAAACVIREGPSGLGLDRGARWLLPALLLGAWAGLQLMPAPPLLVRTISPAADALYRETFPGYGGEPVSDPVAALETRALAAVPEVEGLPEPPRPAAPLTYELGGRWSGWRPLSLAPGIGPERLAWYVALLAGFLVARRRCSDPQVAHLYGSSLAILFTVLALFGLIYAATANDKLYWLFLSASGVTPAGPYVNPNHFAGAMELGTPWLLGWTALRLRRRGPDRGSPPTPLLIAGTVLCTLAGLVTGSRSYPLLLAFSVALLVWMAMRTLWQRLVVLAAVAILGVGGFLIPHPAFRTTLGNDTEEAVPGVSLEVSRLRSWQSGLDVLADFPVAGSGFGSFGEVLPHYRPPGARLRVEQLHNDYLEVIVEGGAVGGILLLWLVLAWVRRTFRRGAIRTGTGVDLEAAGLLAGLAALSLHALWGFNHQIQGNALLFVTMAAIAVARGERSIQEERGAAP